MVTWKKGSHGYWNAYDKEGNKLIVPSVSAVVNMLPDPELDKWIEEVGEEAANRIMRLAGDRGTVMHLYMENYFAAYGAKGDPDKALLYAQRKTIDQLHKLDGDEKIKQKQIETGRRLFYQLHRAFDTGGKNPEVYKVRGLEHKIANFVMPYRGAYDINYLWPKHNRLHNVITDYKSSSKPIESGSIKERKYKLQLSGYWAAYELMTGNKLDYAKIWVSIIDGGTQEVLIDREQYTGLYKEFEDLCIQFHADNNQSLELFKNYIIEDEYN